MERYTLAQRIEIVKTHYKYGESYAETLRKIRTAFGRSKAPSRTTIVKIIAKFESLGQVNDIKSPTHARPIRSVGNIAAVAESVAESPDLSIPKRSQQLGVSRSSLHRILREDLGLHAYKVILTQELKPTDRGQRQSARHKQYDTNVPPKRSTMAKVDSTKAKDADKTTAILIKNEASREKRGTSASDESALERKQARTGSKETKDKDPPINVKKSENESKQLLNKTNTNLGEIDFGCMKTNEEGKKYNLKICTWNVGGLHSVIEKNGVDYMAKEDADIIALQKTKCDTDKLPENIRLPGYHRYFLDSKKAYCCGLALLCKEKPISVKYGLNNSFDNEGRIITAEFSRFFLVNVYTPNSGRNLITLPKRLEWNKVFKKCVEELDKEKPVIICGDMNVAHQKIDLKNPTANIKNAGFTKQERNDMTDLLAAGFIDTFRLLYPNREGAYTFWTYMANARNKRIGWRLDYFLVSDRIKNKVCDNVIRKQICASDHCPVILYIGT